MIKVSDVVLEILNSDELALEAMRSNLLNFSSYADKIHTQVENLTKKPVQRGTVVVTLTRIAKNLSKTTPPLRPDVQINNLSIKTGLTSLTFEKTVDLQRKVAVLNPFQISTTDLFSVIEGHSELTVVVTESALREVKKFLGTDPKAEIAYLAAITCEFDKKYAHIPNFYYTLLSSLATKRISVKQIISNFTEITFIVSEKDLDKAIYSLNAFYSKAGDEWSHSKIY